MKTAAVIVFLIMAIGGFASIFDAEDMTERRFDAAAALIGAGGLAFMGYLRRRKVGAERFRKEMGPPPEWGALAQFFGLTFLAPLFLYWLIRGHFSVNWGGGEGLLAGVLELAGLAAFGFLQLRH